MASIQCRAAVAWGPNQPLTIETVEVAPPKRGEVRIRIKYASLCHTDATTLLGHDFGAYPRTVFPIILGHESTGIVESVGEGVTSVKPGDAVMPNTIPQCRGCPFCSVSKTNWCLSMGPNYLEGYVGENEDRTSRFTCRGQPLYHFFGVSAFSEYTVCRETNVSKLDSDTPLDKVTALACGIRTGYGAALNAAKVEAGSTCAVWGLGPVGLAALAGCKRLGAQVIIAIDTNPDKFAYAKKLGATHCFNPLDQAHPILEEIAKLTNGLGLDYTLDCVGLPETIKQAFDASHKFWGSTTIVGCARPDVNLTLGTSMDFIIGRKVNGCALGSWKGRDAFPVLYEDFRNGHLPLDYFITHRLSLAEINEGFELLNAGKCLKTVIDMS